MDCCATRLRCTVNDAALVKQDVLKASGASGVICKGNGVQVVYGPKVAVIKAKLEDYLESAPKDPVVAPSPAAAPAAKDTVLSACLNGTVVPYWGMALPLSPATVNWWHLLTVRSPPPLRLIMLWA